MANPNAFKDGNHHTGGKKGAKKPSGLYKVMKDIFENKPIKGGKEDSAGIKALRKMLSEKPAEYITKMSQLEVAYLGRPVKKEEPKEIADGPGKEAPVEVDEGAQRVEELIERLLGEYPGGKQ